MKIDTKLIEAMGGCRVPKDEGGGVIFTHTGGGDINILGDDMPKKLSDLIYMIAEIAYERGIESGRKRIQGDLKELLSIK